MNPELFIRAHAYAKKRLIGTTGRSGEIFAGGNLPEPNNSTRNIYVHTYSLDPSLHFAVCTVYRSGIPCLSEHVRNRFGMQALLFFDNFKKKEMGPDSSPWRIDMRESERGRESSTPAELAEAIRMDHLHALGYFDPIVKTLGEMGYEVR